MPMICIAYKSNMQSQQGIGSAKSANIWKF